MPLKIGLKRVEPLLRYVFSKNNIAWMAYQTSQFTCKMVVICLPPALMPRVCRAAAIALESLSSKFLVPLLKRDSEIAAQLETAGFVLVLGVPTPQASLDLLWVSCSVLGGSGSRLRQVFLTVVLDPASLALACGLWVGRPPTLCMLSVGLAFCLPTFLFGVRHQRTRRITQDGSGRGAGPSPSRIGGRLFARLACRSESRLVASAAK